MVNITTSTHHKHLIWNVDEFAFYAVEKNKQVTAIHTRTRTQPLE